MYTPEQESQEHLVNLLSGPGVSILIFIGFGPIYIPTSSVQGLPFPVSSPSLLVSGISVLFACLPALLLPSLPLSLSLFFSSFSLCRGPHHGPCALQYDLLPLSRAFSPVVCFLYGRHPGGSEMESQCYISTCLFTTYASTVSLIVFLSLSFS